VANRPTTIHKHFSDQQTTLTALKNVPPTVVKLNHLCSFFPGLVCSEMWRNVKPL